MAVRNLIFYPSQILRDVSSPVTSFNGKIRMLLDDMTDTMYHERGIGLAAPQVGISTRAIVIDLGPSEKPVADEPAGLIKLLNPEIISSEGRITSEEGCLSIPDIRENVTRNEFIEVSSLSEKGEPLRFQASGLLAICIQHEIDHLNGILFIDHLSKVKKSLLKKQLKQLSK